VIIDTINDVVVRDVGEEIVNTGGVAVRPFWWSTECLAALGLASTGGGTDTTKSGDNSGDTSSTTAQGSGDTSGAGGAGGETGLGADTGTGDAGGNGSGVGEGAEERGAGVGGGLSGGWIALIVALGVVAVGALGGLAFLLGRASHGARLVGAPADATTAAADAAATTTETAATAERAASAAAAGSTAAAGAGSAAGTTPETTAQTQAASLFCSHCGGAVNPEAKFCAGCGKPV